MFALETATEIGVCSFRPEVMPPPPFGHNGVPLPTRTHQHVVAVLVRRNENISSSSTGMRLLMHMLSPTRCAVERTLLSGAASK